MSPPSNTEQGRARAAQVGFVMRAYRESFPRERGGRGISQDELLRRMADADPGYARRTSHVTVSRWESGFTHPTVQRLEIFGRALNLSVTEIDGLILMAGLDPSVQEGRTLTCPQCRAETRTVQAEQRQIGTNGGSITAVTRTRRCLGCGRINESCERWAYDPSEAPKRRMQEILDRMEEANDQIRQSLYEANELHGFPDNVKEPEGNDSPGSEEEGTVDDYQHRETATGIHDGETGQSLE